MISQRALAEDYAAKIEGLGPISVHPYFAGASLRADGVQFGFVMKGVLYLKADEVNRGAFERHGCAPFTYAGASGQVTVAAYYEVPDEALDDPEDLSGWATNALRAARSVPKRKRAAP